MKSINIIKTTPLILVSILTIISALTTLRAQAYHPSVQLDPAVQATIQPTIQPVAYHIPSQGLTIFYNGTRFRCYPNHLIIAEYYNREIIRKMLGLSRELGWRTVYVYGAAHPRGIPGSLQGYANQYFRDRGVKLKYFATRYYDDRDNAIIEFRFGDDDYRWDHHRGYRHDHRHHNDGGSIHFRFGF